MWSMHTFNCPSCPCCITSTYIQVDKRNEHFYHMRCPAQNCKRRNIFYVCRICPNNTVSPPKRGRDYFVKQHVSTNRHIAAVALLRNSTVNPDGIMDSIVDSTIRDDGIRSGDPFIAMGDDVESDTDFGENLSHNNDCFPDNVSDDSPISLSAISIYTNEDYISAINNLPTPLPAAITELFNKQHQPYFDACVNHEGHKFITNLATTNIPTAYKTQEKPIPSLYLLLLSKLSIEITIPQQQILASLLSHVFQNALMPLQLRPPLFVPASANHIRHKIIDGKYSIRENLPIPEIIEYSDGFIYISLKSTIKHLFCSEQPPNPYLPFSTSVHANTPRGKELLDLDELSGSLDYNNDGYPIYPIKGIPWADDFEPFTVIRNNGQSVHVCFITLGAMDGDHSGRYTMLLWLGRQKASPAEVEKKLQEEVNEINEKPFLVYSKKHSCIVDVKLKLYAFLCDRPDKSKRLQMLNGGNTHACWSYCGEYKNAIARSVLCQGCFTKLLNNEPIGSRSSTVCDFCYCLDFTLMKSTKHDDYPTEMLPPSTTLLPFKKVTIDSMKAACRIGFEQIKNKAWNQKQLLCYLRCEGLNAEYSMQIYANASKAALSSLVNPMSPEIEEQMRSNPASFQLPAFPPLWGIKKHFGPDIFVDCPMHLLFLGTYKSLNKIHLPRFLTPISKKSTAIQFINTKLRYITVDLPKNLNQSKVHYLPLHPSCGSSEMNYGKWLSKNWIAHQRISKWIHADFPTYATHDLRSSSVQGKLFPSYTLAEIRRWCSTRGVPIPRHIKKLNETRAWFINIVVNFDQLFSHYSEDDILKYIETQNDLDGLSFDHIRLMTSTELKVWFGTYVEQKKKHPPELPPKFNVELLRQDIQDLISLHLCIVSRVMHGCSGKSVGRHVKMYLTIFFRVDKALGFVKNNPAIITQMNLITLLNLEPTIDRFGPLRYLWEGGGMGEGSIPKVKQFIHDMKPKFARNAVTSHLRKVSLDNLLSSACNEVNAQMQPNETDNHNSYDHLNHLLRAVAESFEKEANKNGVGGSLLDLDVPDEPFSGEDKGGEKVSTYTTHAHGSQFCPIGRGDLVVPVVIDVNDSGIFIAVKNKTLVRVLLSHHHTKHVMDASFLFSSTTQSGTLQWTEKKKRDLVCGLMLRHKESKDHYYVVNMNWMEARMNKENCLSFALPRFRGALYEDGVDEKSSLIFFTPNQHNSNKRQFDQEMSRVSTVI